MGTGFCPKKWTKFSQLFCIFFDKICPGFKRASLKNSPLGSVDLDLGCSTVLPNHTASYANFPSAQAEPGKRWKCQNQSQVREEIDLPVCTQYSLKCEMTSPAPFCSLGNSGSPLILRKSSTAGYLFWIKSNQDKSNQNKQNQIKTKQIKSIQTKSSQNISN